MSGRRRVDQLLVERGLAPSRARAQALLLAGRVFSGERKIDKAGTQLAEDAPLLVREGERYVSRGGHKLEGAVADLKLDPTGNVVVDVGASTGGFTDFLLQHGAARVYAVDVGENLLAQSLREDARVVVMDRVNARHLDASSFPEAIDWVVVDASFIGIDKLLPALARVLPSGGTLLAMIKPQFEVGKDAARRAKGVIKDPALRLAALDAAKGAIAAAGFTVLGGADSRLPGPKGNVEHFVLARRN